MFSQVTDKVRSAISDVLVSQVGNNLKPIRIIRGLLSTTNDLVGRPFCTAAELASRRASTGPSAAASPKREAAPVVVYFDGKDQRSKKKIEELLKAREIAYQIADVADDEATRSWALTTAKQAEFPLLFVAGEPIGGLHELTQADVNGDLSRRVFGK